MILDRVLINESNEYNSYVMIKGKFSEFREYRNFGCLSNDVITTQGQSIRHSIMEYLLSLQERDFILEFVEQPNKFIDIRSNIAGPSNESFYFSVQKTGNLLYHIPRLMQVDRPYRCIVRIAYYRELLFIDWKTNDDDVEKGIRIGEEMQVKIIDVNSGYINFFDIKPLNKKSRQLLDADDYTEWLFDVKPLKLGTSLLRLHITAFEIRNGREVTKEIVLEEEVVIITSKPDDNPINLEKYKDTFTISKSNEKIKEKIVEYESEAMIMSILNTVLSILLFPIALLFSLFTGGTGGKKSSDDDDGDDD